MQKTHTVHDVSINIGASGVPGAPKKSQQHINFMFPEFFENLENATPSTRKRDFLKTLPFPSLNFLFVSMFFVGPPGTPPDPQNT